MLLVHSYVTYIYQHSVCFLGYTSNRTTKEGNLSIVQPLLSFHSTILLGKEWDSQFKFMIIPNILDSKT